MGQPHRWAFWLLLCMSNVQASISREAITDRFFPQRTNPGESSPFPLGNGNLGFNVDITGLQSIRPFSTVSAWKSNLGARPAHLNGRWAESFSRAEPALPYQVTALPGDSQLAVPQFNDRIVNVPSSFSLPANFSLLRLGFLWEGRELQASEIKRAVQTFNLSAGHLLSVFEVADQPVAVETLISPTFDAISFEARSQALSSGTLTVFLEFPTASILPAETNQTQRQQQQQQQQSSSATSFTKWNQRAQITHAIDRNDSSTRYYANLHWLTDRSAGSLTQESGAVPRPRFTLNVTDAAALSLTVSLSPHPDAPTPAFDDVRSDAHLWWRRFWRGGGFVACTAEEQWAGQAARDFTRRVLMTQYALAVSAAGTDAPGYDGSGGNGDGGDDEDSSISRLRDAMWTLGHWYSWGRLERAESALPLAFAARLPTARTRARRMGGSGASWVGADGAHWWSQAGPMWLAEEEWKVLPERSTLDKWRSVVEESSEFMSEWMKKNESTGAWDLHVPSGEGKPARRNPAQDVVYWRYGLDVARKWYERARLPVPERIRAILSTEAPLDFRYGAYTWDGNSKDPLDMLLPLALLWDSNALNRTELNGTLSSVDSLMSFARHQDDTTFSVFYGPHLPRYGLLYPLVGMINLELGNADSAVSWLQDDRFRINDAGMPINSAETFDPPYLPSAGAFLLTVARMAEHSQWPKNWTCESEGFARNIS